MPDSLQQVARDMLVNEAQNLHAIQKNAKAMMLRVIDRLDSYPEARERLRAHLTDKDNEMSRLEQVLGMLGKDRSGFKDTAMSAMGGMTAMMSGTWEDDIIKSSLLTFALASYEIASYEAMVQLAQRGGLPDAVPLLNQCLAEEKAMAEWLHEHMSPTLDQYLELRATEGMEAAH